MLLGDGYCHDVTNNAECDFDGGDCCDYEWKIKKDHCSECACHIEETCTSVVGHPLVGDGVCNDHTNIEACMYDGIDCCEIDFGETVEDPITTYCTECLCHGTDQVR